MSLPIDFFAMTDPQNRHRSCCIIYFIDNTIVSDANPPASIVRQLPAARRSGFVTQGIDFLFDGIVRSGVKRRELFFGAWQDAERVNHFRLRSIRAIASSKGTGVSPEALASSYSRIASMSSSSSRIFSYSSMLMTTATFSPRSFTTNWRSFPMEISLRAVYSRAERRAIQTEVACSKASFVVGRGSHFEDGEEGFLRNVDLADALHAALAFFLFFEEFTFARDVAAVALGENVFADRRNRFARNHTAADRGLDRHFKQLPRNQFSQAGHEFAAALVGMFAVANQRQRIHRFASDQHVQLDQVGFAVAREMIVKRSVAA